jgi:competence protein ComEC
VAAFESLECDGRALPPLRARLYGGPKDAARGDRFELVVQVGTVELFRNAELVDPTPYAARAGVTLSGSILAATESSRAAGLGPTIDHARGHARERIDATFVPLAAPLARALVLGENDLSEDDDAAFRSSGLSHLLAVSGTHLVFAVLGVVHALGAVLRRVESLAGRYDVARFSAAFGAVLAPLYADFAGGSGSARRAAFMLCIGLGARALGRAGNATRAFALSIVVGAALDPLVGFDISFLLSVAATGGLLSLGRLLSARLVNPRMNAVIRGAAASLAATLSAMAPCAPLLAMLGPSITIAGIFANVVAAPFGEVVALPLCLAHAIVFFGPLERGIGLVASGALLVVRSLARGSAAATYLAVPVPPPSAWHFVALAVGVLGAASCAVRLLRCAWLGATVAALFVLERAAIEAGHPRGVLRITVLDVGQGDATLIDLPDGSLMLVDGGGFVGSPVDPGARVILPVLRERRRDRIDVSVLSHPHPDHYLGLATTLASVPTGELWDTGQGRAQGAGPEYHGMLRTLAARGTPVRGPAELCAAPRFFAVAEITALSPCPAFDPGLGANDNSFVLRVRLGKTAALLTGDAEHEAEERLLASGATLEADLLKTGHHGSRTSTSPAFLRATRPRYATLSCGIRNRFGHPHPETLETLSRAGVPALRSDLFGSVEWRADGRTARLRTFSGGPFAARVSSGGLQDLPFW